jgi:hypothetical protein
LTIDSLEHLGHDVGMPQSIQNGDQFQYLFSNPLFSCINSEKMCLKTARGSLVTTSYP